jgi:homoserine kinase
MRSSIPLSGGLGSSGAACVAGLIAADRVRGGGSELLSEAIEMEGHPDNVAASLLGGVTVYVDGRAARMEPPEGLSAILVVPRTAVRTSAARAALPASVPLNDAAANSGHAALLALGLERGDLDLVAAGLRDRIHQPYRAHLYPQSAALLERAPELGALGATISGAGPTVLVWARTEAAGDVREALEREADGWATVMPAAFEPRGAQILEC